MHEELERLSPEEKQSVLVGYFTSTVADLQIDNTDEGYAQFLTLMSYRVENFRGKMVELETLVRGARVTESLQDKIISAYLECINIPPAEIDLATIDKSHGLFFLLGPRGIFSTEIKERKEVERSGYFYEANLQHTNEEMQSLSQAVKQHIIEQAKERLEKWRREFTDLYHEDVIAS